MDSGFKVNNVILIECSFSRINQVVFEGDINNDISIHVDVATQKDSVTVSEDVTVSQKFKGEEQAHIFVKMVGLFTRIGDSSIDNLEDFGKVNGAAIIFPYIREIVSSTTLKAGMPAIILPPVNFTKIPEK